MARTYVVALQARSAVRVAPDSEIVVNAKSDAGEQRVVIRTTYEPYGNSRVPRSLWFEVVGPGIDLDMARDNAQMLADAMANIMCVTMNASVDSMMPTVAFDATPDGTEHEYWQYVIPPNSGLPRASRLLNRKIFDAFNGAIVESEYRDVLFRSCGYFRIAVENAVPGKWLLALAYGWMAVEALKVPALSQELARRGFNRAELASEWSVPTRELKNEARKRLLFSGSPDLHDRVRGVSNDFEHALEAFGPLQTAAEADAIELLNAVRHSILRVAYNSDAPVTLPADTEIPLASVPLQESLTATILGEAASLAPEDLQYPHLDITTKSVTVDLTDTGGFKVQRDLEVTVRTGDGTAVRDISFKTIGPPGSSPLNADINEINLN